MGSKKPSKIEIITDLLILKKVFEFVDLTFFIQEGGVLGYGRSGDIMDHDFDIDIGSTDEPSEKQKEALYHALMAKGWHNIVPRGDFDFAVRATTLNIWWWHKEGQFYVARPTSTPGKIFIMRSIWFDPPHNVAIYPFGKFCIPNHHEDYLDHRYGKDWREHIVLSDDDWKAEEKRRKAEGEDLWPKFSWDEI